MREVLFVDCCVRGDQSRTARLARAFIGALDKSRFHVTTVDPGREGLKPLTAETLHVRDELLARGALDDESLQFARQFAAADEVVVAAPFWELSFPAILKVYIENVSVAGISFEMLADGMRGLCRGKHLVFLTTRGGVYEGTAWADLEQGSRTMEALSRFFGFDEYICVAAEGLDMTADPEPLVAEGEERARAVAAAL